MVRPELLAMPPGALRGHRAGWLALAVFTFAEAAVGHSVIGGDEPLVFLVVLGSGLAFEAGWYLLRGSNTIRPREHGS
jgi:hypothetical protein